MKIARYLGQEGEILEGVVEGDEIEEISGLDSMLQGGRRVGGRRKIAGVQLQPWGIGRKIIAIGKNYVDHAKEMKGEVPKQPLLFMKPNTALIAHGQPIVLPPFSNEVHHEAELAVVIGKRLRKASEAECAKAIAAVTCLNDVTARDLQKSDGQWTRAKGCDTFCPIGPWVVVGLDWRDLRIQARVNGETRQDGRSSAQVFPLPVLLAFISAAITIEEGDIISTGTPSGVGPLKAGDVVEIEVEGVGILRNPVQAAEERASPATGGARRAEHP
jgi:2-keto-4-pentenoate hydratase/2-oxohepta-3-ene-1,7-dioic acid hydratase in catechol pathway